MRKKSNEPQHKQPSGMMESGLNPQQKQQGTHLLDKVANGIENILSKFFNGDSELSEWSQLNLKDGASEIRHSKENVQKGMTKAISMLLKMSEVLGKAKNRVEEAGRSHSEKSGLSITLNPNSDFGDHSGISSGASSSTSNGTKAGEASTGGQYESMLQKLENDVRQHIRVPFHLNLRNEASCIHGLTVSFKFCFFSFSTWIF